MQNLGYAALVTGSTVIVVSEAKDEVFILNRSDDGHAVIEHLSSLIASEASVDEVIDYISTVPTMRVVT